jgi:uncharacterized membrane protein
MTDPLFPVLLLLRYMHILGAIMLMGGTIFMRFALRPAAKSLPPDVHAGLHEQVRGRWAKAVALASLLLLVSGLANLALASRNTYDPVFGLNYNMVVGIKFLLALPIFFIAAILMGRSNLSQKFKANAEMWMNVNLTLALVMVLIGGVLRFVPRQPKNAAAPPAATAAAVDQNASQKLPFTDGGE